MKKKTLAASIMSIAMCGSLVTGATFALFTSESKTNVAISSGKVEVVATLENLEVYSPTLITADGKAILNADNAASNDALASGGVFANGGTAVLESPEITLNNMTPGDYATFQIKITNYSTVNTQYRTVLKVVDDNGLLNGLEMGIKSNEAEEYVAYQGETIYSDWAALSIPAGESEVVELNDCKIELPIGAGNEYQEKSCKFVCVVEAIQANADTNNYVAKIGANSYETLEEAVADVEAGETIEITRPGTYAPFTIDKAGVTVKGIVGASKAASTVIKNTATQNIQVYADEVTLESLYIDTTTTQSLNWMHAGAVDPYINTNSGIVAKGLEINGCYMVGNGVAHAMLYCSDNLVFTGNTLENFGVGIYVMSDGHDANGFDVTGNTFINVKEPVNAYWGNTVEEKAGAVVIKDNKIEGDDVAYVTLWDLSQKQHNTTAFADIQVSNNSGDIVYNLTHFNYKVATPHTVTVGASGEQEVRYLSRISSDIPFAERNDYEVQMADGSAWDSYLGSNTFTQNIDGKAGLYTLATGTYNLVNTKTNLVVPFDVTDPIVGRQQTIKLPKETVSVGTAADLLAALNNTTNNNSGATVIELSSDINVNGQWTAFNLPYAADTLIINGNDHTITGLNEPLLNSTTAGSTKLIVNKLTISGADINYDAMNNRGTVSAAGAFIAYGDASGEMTFNDCHVVNSSIVCTGDYAGAFVGYVSNNDGSGAQFNNCSVIGTTVKGNSSVGGFVGHAYISKFDNCKVEGCTIESSKVSDWRVGAIIGTVNTSCEIKTCTSAGNTLTQSGANGGSNKNSAISDLFGRSYGTGTSINSGERIVTT